MSKLKTMIPIILIIISFLSFTFSSAPMTKDEALDYLAQIKSHQHIPGGRHNIKDVTDFFLSDDGKPFYTVNLYKYHDTANYQQSTATNITGQDAYDKFSEIMIKLLLSNYAYPIFASDWLAFSDKSWHRIVIVRYPNRRAMAEIFADERFSVASEHKWASIAQHDRFIVQGIHLPELSLVVVLAISFLLLITLLIKRLKSN